MTVPRRLQAPELIPLLAASLVCLVVLASGSATEAKASLPSVGVIGCSNSRDTVAGYQLDGGTRFWQLSPGQYGGGTLVAWAANHLQNTYWSQFQQLLSQHPSTTRIWWSLCTHPTDTDAQDFQAALAIVAKIHQLVPNALIYVSAINGYVAPHVCSLLGSRGPSRMQTLADALVSQGAVSAAGPAVGSLVSIFQTPSDGATTDNNRTVPDGCHPNAAGSKDLGHSLQKFFG